jgi:hypothetical protein
VQQVEPPVKENKYGFDSMHWNWYLYKKKFNGLKTYHFACVKSAIFTCCM